MCPLVYLHIYSSVYYTFPMYMYLDAPNPSFNGSEINPAMESDCRFSFLSGYWICGWFWGFTLGHACCSHGAQRA